MKTILSILALVVIALTATPAAGQTVQSVTSNMRYTWDQPSTGITLAQANALIATSYLDTGPEGPTPAKAHAEAFKCVTATDTSIYTCQLTRDVAAFIGSNTGIHRIIVSVATKNADGSLTAEAFAPEWTFRFDVATAGTPRNPRFAAPLP